MTNKIITFFLFSIFFSGYAVAEITPEQQIAKEQGLALFQQNNWHKSQLLLEDAATAGDQTAQYYLGEAIRLSKRYTTAEAKKWYEAAAEQGNLYAMLRLSNKDDLCSELGSCDGRSAGEWRDQVLKLARERAEKGDTEAMTVLFITKQGLKWLEKAAEAGDHIAQNTLAGVYKDGDGWFLVPGSRDKAVNKWYKLSAEGGYPRAMYLYANYLYTHGGKKEEMAYWLRKSVEGGYINAIGTYALSVAHIPDDLGYPQDLVQAYGLAYLLSKLEGGGIASEDGKEILPEIAEKMTEDQVKQGVAFARDWEKTRPPLSYYVPIYGY